MSNNANSRKTDSAYDAFINVDKLVNKPIVGSDGAASWQAFRSTAATHHESSHAPMLQVKKKDQLATGFLTIHDEKAHENAIRMASGEANVGSGYVNFKQKTTLEDARTSKETKRIRERKRPEEKEYFINTGGEFQGYKFDYIFTTRDGRTGYYWDGTDSLKKLNGIVTIYSERVNQALQENDKTASASTKEGIQDASERPKKKKKKSNTIIPALPQIDEAMNHRELVANAIRTQQEAMTRPPESWSTALPPGWQQATDTTSQKVYYYHGTTGQRQWEKPTMKTTTATTIAQDESPLPDGWQSAKDASTGKEYYYHSSGETKWERPA